MLKNLLFPCLVLFFALSLVDAKPPTMPKDDGWWLKGKSTILKSSNFEGFVREEPNVIVEFITSFSTDSQKMSDEWNKLAEMYMGENPKRTDIKVAIVDGWTFSTVSHEYGVKVFPQILLFTGNSKEAKARYEGERTAEKISEWAEAQIALAKTETIQAVDDAVATSDAVTDAPTSAGTASTTDSQTQTQTDSSATPQQTQTDQAAAPVETKPPVDNNAATNQQQQQQQQQQPPQQAQQAQQTQQPPQQAQQPPQQAQQAQQTQQQQIPPPPAQQQQQQQPPKPQTPPPQQQQKQENSAPVAQEEAKPKEVKVVLNTTLLQSQFESLQKHFDGVTENLKANINDNVNKIAELKVLLDTQKQEMANLHISLRGQTQKFDELKQVLLANKQEVQQSVTGHTEKHLEEVKGALHQIKGKVFEAKPTESKGFGGGFLYLLIGGVVGGAVTFVLLNMSRNNKKRKLLID